MITHVQVQVLSLAPKSSGYGAVGSALVWGARGREFKSRYSDHGKRGRLIFKRPCFYFVFNIAPEKKTSKVIFKSSENT